MSRVIRDLAGLRVQEMTNKFGAKEKKMVEKHIASSTGIKTERKMHRGVSAITKKVEITSREGKDSNGWPKSAIASDKLSWA